MSMHPEYRKLMERYVELGQLLIPCNGPDDVDADVVLALEEMQEIEIELAAPHWNTLRD